MGKSSAAVKQNEHLARDVGTMWTMTRHDCTARCALLSRSEDWELRLLINGDPLLSRRRSEIQELFDTATEWRERMAARGWRQVTPGLRAPLASAEALT